jgi:hypothetical protein
MRAHAYDDDCSGYCSLLEAYKMTYLPRIYPPVYLCISSHAMRRDRLHGTQSVDRAAHAGSTGTSMLPYGAYDLRVLRQ